jgi:ABC-type sugar transport system permease subunit
MKSVRPHPAWAPWFFLGPFLLIFGLFFAWPLVRALALSFEQTYGPGTVIFVGPHNFRALGSDRLFWTALLNTAEFTVGSLLLQMPAALGLALLLNRPSIRGRRIFRLVFFSPSLIGMVFAAVLFALIFEKQTGLINQGLHLLFSRWDPDFPWLDEHVMLSLLLAALWLYAGFNMVYFLAALQNVPPEHLEAAAIDGANAWQRFWHVTLPSIRPVSRFIVLLSVSGSFQVFVLPYVIFYTTQGAVPLNGGLTVLMHLYKTGFIAGDLGYASAIGWVMTLLLLAVALIHHRLGGREENRP